jgi:antitoxin (DNA-binding transcriptional repressor) of toxin-antitoxin stability system
MVRVTVAEAKTQLSSLLDAVEAGEAAGAGTPAAATNPVVADPVRDRDETPNRPVELSGHPS